MTGGCALLMALSMVINESLVARTFGAYTLQLFDGGDERLIPILAVGLIVLAFLVNIAGNRLIGVVSKVTAVIKIVGILAFAGTALWASGWSFRPAAGGLADNSTFGGFLAGVALAILAYKGFTTITNSGDELESPERNVGRAIMISLSICVVIYIAVAFGVASTLTVEEIVAARDYSLAEAARPAVGDYGVWFTVGIAIVATASGLLASIFAVSRMLAMLTEMNVIPHRHFGMPGDIQKHTLVYTVVAAAVLAALFDLGRIASLGAIFYLVMDIAIHWGVLKYLRDDVNARATILVAAIVLDILILVSLVVLKWQADPFIVLTAVIGIAVVFGFERWYLAGRRTAHHGEHDR